MKIIFTVLFLCLCCSLKAQVFSGSKVIYLDNGKTDSLVRAKYHDQLNSSYYVFLYPLYGAVTTYAPQIIKEYNALKDFKIRKCDEDILFVFDNNSGISERQIRQYMKETFLLDESGLNSIKFIVDETLYHQLNFGGELAKLLYINRSKLAYKNDCKLNSIADQFLPHEMFSITPESKTALNMDSLLVLEKDNLSAYKEGHLLLLSEVKNLILDIDTKNGNVKKVEIPAVDATELYGKLIAHGDTQKYNFAKRYNYLSVNTNRKSFAVNAINYQDGFIYAFFTLEAYERNPGEYKFLDDNGKRTSFRKGIPILTAYYGLMRIDAAGNCSFYEIENITYNKKIEKYPRFASGSRISHDTIFTTNLYSPALNDTNKAISAFKLGPAELSYIGDLKGATSAKMQSKLSYNNIKNFFIDINHTSYYAYDVSGDIYNLKTGKVRSSFFGDGITPNKKETFKNYMEEDKPVNFNYDIHAVSTIFNGNYLIAYYTYNGSPVFEIKDKYLDTQEVMSAKNIAGFENYISSKYTKSICFSGDHVYYISIEKGTYYLNEFRISQKCQ